MFAVYIILQLTLSQVELSNVELCDVPSVRTIRLFVRTFCRVLCSILISMYNVTMYIVFTILNIQRRLLQVPTYVLTLKKLLRHFASVLVTSTIFTE